MIGHNAAPLVDSEHAVVAPDKGILIGRTHLPLVYEGEALFHIARFQRVAEAAQQVEMQQEVDSDM